MERKRERERERELTCARAREIEIERERERNRERERERERGRERIEIGSSLIVCLNLQIHHSVRSFTSDETVGEMTITASASVLLSLGATCAIVISIVDPLDTHSNGSGNGGG